MKKTKPDRRYFILGLSVLSLTALLILWKFGRQQEKPPSPLPGNSEKSSRNSLERGISEKGPIRQSRELDPKNYRFVAVPLPEYPDESSSIIYPAFDNPAFQTGGGTGGRFTIRNRNREIIWRGNEENRVFSITASPDEELVWVSAGDGRSYIISADGKKIKDMPQRPPGKDLMVFDVWQWIDNDRLLGKSGIQKYDDNGILVTCCGGDNVSESKFFIYNLKTGRMEEMLLPGIFLGKVVTIRKVLNSGAFQLAHEEDEPHWFQIREK